MKNVIKIAVLAIGLVILNSACFAQRTVSLRTYEIHRNNYIDNIDRSEDWDDVEMHVIDVDNELDKFTGVWKGSINNRNYELSVVKRTGFRYGFVDESKSWDLLICWITVRDNAGNVIYTNTNKAEKSNNFSGENFQTGTNIYRLNFTGKCYNDSGNAFFSINPTTGKLRLTYAIISDIKSNECPNEYVPVLPTTSSMELTKQLLID